MADNPSEEKDAAILAALRAAGGPLSAAQISAAAAPKIGYRVNFFTGVTAPGHGRIGTTTGAWPRASLKRLVAAGQVERLSDGRYRAVAPPSP